MPNEDIPAAQLAAGDMVLIPPSTVAYIEHVEEQRGFTVAYLRHGRTHAFRAGELATRIRPIPREDAKSAASS